MAARKLRRSLSHSTCYIPLLHYSHSKSIFNLSSIEYRHTHARSEHGDFLSHSIGIETQLLQLRSSALSAQAAHHPCVAALCKAMACRRTLSLALTQARALTGSHRHRRLLKQALQQHLLSLILWTLLRNTFRCRVRSQRAQLSETRPRRAVSQQSVVGQSARTQLALRFRSCNNSRNNLRKLKKKIPQKITNYFTIFLLV